MPDRLLAWLQLLRLPAIFTTWSNILAAHLIATGGQFQWRSLLLLLGSSSALYLAGMVLNDCFDLSEDQQERPDRPLPSGRIGTRGAWLTGWGLLLLGLLLAAVVGTTQLLIALLLSLMIISYDGWLKQGPLGPVIMGICRYLNWILGLSLLPLTGDSWLLPLPVLLYIASLTTLSRIETTANSRWPLMLCISGVLAAALSIPALLGTGTLKNSWVLLPLVLLSAILLGKLTSLDRGMTPKKIQGTVKLMLLGIIPLDALLVFAAGPWWGPLLLLLLLPPGRYLARIIAIT